MRFQSVKCNIMQIKRKRTKNINAPHTLERMVLDNQVFWHNRFKDGLPYLFHSFRNKYFNKISLGNMLYFQNKL